MMFSEGNCNGLGLGTHCNASLSFNAAGTSASGEEKSHTRWRFISAAAVPAVATHDNYSRPAVVD